MFSSIFLPAGESFAGLVFISQLEQGPSPHHSTRECKTSSYLIPPWFLPGHDGFAHKSGRMFPSAFPCEPGVGGSAAGWAELSSSKLGAGTSDV